MSQCIDDADVLQNKALQTSENEFFPGETRVSCPNIDAALY